MLCLAASVHADEGGVSFWLPGQQSNFAAQARFFIPVGKSKGYVSVLGYFEFGAEHRTEGWNGWLTLAIPLDSGK